MHPDEGKYVLLHERIFSFTHALRLYRSDADHDKLLIVLDDTSSKLPQLVIIDDGTGTTVRCRPFADENLHLELCEFLLQNCDKITTLGLHSWSAPDLIKLGFEFPAIKNVVVHDFSGSLVHLCSVCPDTTTVEVHTTVLTHELLRDVSFAPDVHIHFYSSTDARTSVIHSLFTDLTLYHHGRLRKQPLPPVNVTGHLIIDASVNAVTLHPETSANSLAWTTEMLGAATAPVAASVRYLIVKKIDTRWIKKNPTATYPALGAISLHGERCDISALGTPYLNASTSQLLHDVQMFPNLERVFADGTQIST